MKIAAAVYEFKNNDVRHNICKVKAALEEAKDRADIVFFGETFLQGFDALNWNFENDKNIAIVQSDPIMNEICDMSKECGVDIGIGYLELYNDAIYSSYGIIIQGNLKYNYRRISDGWREVSLTDDHYREGNEVLKFNYKGKDVIIALCGDLWVCPEKFKDYNNDILIWPVYVNFALDEWANEEVDYLERAATISDHTLLVNSVSSNPVSHGGGFYFEKGKIAERFPYDCEGILIVEV